MHSYSLPLARSADAGGPDSNRNRANPDDFEEIGEEHHDELDVIKPEMIWRRTIRKKFKHKTDKARPPVIAPAPLPSIPGTLCAPALAAQIITDKFADHLPHYRQSQRLRRRHEADIGRQTLNTWTQAAARHLEPVNRAIKAEVLKATELQVDETAIEYLKPGHGSTKTGYLWIYNDPQSGTCHYDWHTGRGHDCLLDFLGYDPLTNTLGYEGTIQCDGYSAYLALAARFKTIRLAGCLAHAPAQVRRSQRPFARNHVALHVAHPAHLSDRNADPQNPGPARLPRTHCSGAPAPARWLTNFSPSSMPPVRPHCLTTPWAKLSPTPSTNARKSSSVWKTADSRSA